MKITLREFRSLVRRLVESELDDEMSAVEVGDVIDVDQEVMGIMSVRVIELVPDVRKAVGMPADEDLGPGHETFSGPGFVGEIDPESGESGQMVFSLGQVLPGSKAKGYFPKGESDWEQDDRNDVPPDIYRKMATRFATKAIEPANSYVSGLPDDMSDRYRSH